MVGLFCFGWLRSALESRTKAKNRLTTLERENESLKKQLAAAKQE